MKQLPLDGLIRVSQRAGREDKDLRSLDQQRDIIEREAGRLGVKLHLHPPAVGLSGKTLDRRDIAMVLERIRAGKSGGLITAFARRLSRARVYEALTFKAAVEEAGGRLVICDMAGIDLDSAGGEFAFTVMVAAARPQWRQIAENH